MLKGNIVISAIITCYNHGAFLDDALRSLIQQSLSIKEIIVVDDGSTDKFTLEKLEAIKLQPYIKVITIKHSFPAAARNIGFQHTSGDYVVVLDADDMLERRFLEKALSILQYDSQVAAVSCWTLGFGTRDFLWRPLNGGVENFLFENNCPVTALIRRTAWLRVGGFDESMELGYEDWDFWLMLTKNDWKLNIIPEVLFFYRQKAYSRVTSANSHRESIYLYLMNKHKDVFKFIYPNLIELQ